MRCPVIFSTINNTVQKTFKANIGNTIGMLFRIMVISKNKCYLIYVNNINMKIILPCHACGRWCRRKTYFVHCLWYFLNDSEHAPAAMQYYCVYSQTFCKSPIQGGINPAYEMSRSEEAVQIFLNLCCVVCNWRTTKCMCIATI